MQALVHFAVGLSMGIVVLVFVDQPVRQEFLFLFASGIWAMVPDVHWIFREFGFERAANVGKAIHGSLFANVFWFHQIIDGMETDRPNLEAGVALAVLLTLVLGYYFFNDWAAT